jgi:L-threonylcarbamoyladenylate synthase
MKFVRPPSLENISLAAKALHRGALIGFPTETVYGLAADAENESAIKKIYEVKGRPNDHPLIIHIGSLDYLENWAIEIPSYVWTLANQFWPGPMTLLLQRSKLAKNFITGSQETVGIRIPNNKVGTSILKEFHRIGGRGLAIPSANRFSAVSPTTAQAVVEELEPYLTFGHDFVIDGGICEIGIESTIIKCLGTKPIILRKGLITASDIEKKCDIKTDLNIQESNIKFSGNFAKHYSPKAKVVINGPFYNGDGLIAIDTFQTPKNCLRLASPRNINEFGQQLYSTFRLADRLNLQRLYVILPEDSEFGAAINDRVRRAMNQ